MGVRKIILVILAASVGIMAERIDFADADYCFDFRDKPQRLLLIKTHRELEIRDTVEVEDIYISSKIISILSQVDLTKELEFHGRGGYVSGMGYSSSNSDKTTPKSVTKLEIFEQLNFPKDMYLVNNRPEYDVKKESLLFKKRIVDGNMMVSVTYTPSIDTTYNLNFRAKITGECTADFLSNYDRSQRR
jgi:hypothetical protein